MTKGNGRGEAPFRISVIPRCAIDGDTLMRNVAASAHIPMVEPAPPHGRPLAVVGGGPNVANHIDELRAWGGDIWAINYTGSWLANHGIRSTVFSIDPIPMSARVADGVDSAILASCCHPDAASNFPSTRRFHLSEHDEGGVIGGSTSACRAPFLALRLGYGSVTFFGCEGSFFDDDHVDRTEQREDQVIVRAGGIDYRTAPDLMLQCQNLAALIMAFPQFLSQRGGGLLGAMVEHPDTWEVVAVSGPMKRSLEEYNGPSGLYDGEYQWVVPTHG